MRLASWLRARFTLSLKQTKGVGKNDSFSSYFLCDTHIEEIVSAQSAKQASFSPRTHFKFPDRRSTESSYEHGRKDQRSDESNESKDSEYSSMPPGTMTIETLLETLDPYRVVVPGPARPGPMDFFDPSQANREKFLEVQDSANSLIIEHSINAQPLRLIRLQVRGESQVDRDTFYVEARDTENHEHWRETTIALYRHLLDQGCRDFEIELVYPPLQVQRFSESLEENELLLAQAEAALPDVRLACRRHLDDAWSSIAFTARGNIRTREMRPTCVVYCNPGSTGNFKSAEQECNVMLHERAPLFAFEISVGRAILSDPRDERPYIWNNPSKLPPTWPETGASLGTVGHPDRAGSLGYYFFLNMAGLKPIPVVITCYHIVRPEGEAFEAEVNENGFDWRKQGYEISAEVPATCDREASLDYWRRQGEKSGELVKRAGKLIQALKDARVAGPFGNVILASGDNISNPSGVMQEMDAQENVKKLHRTDWALLTAEHVKGTKIRFNRIPQESDIPEGDYPEDGYVRSPDLRVQQLTTRVPKAGDWVTKIGRTSGTTYGVIPNAIPRCVKWRKGFETLEHEIYALAGGADFSAGGDSGSMITNAKGEVVGLLFGKATNSLSGCSGLYTPMCILQSMVKQKTGGFLTLDI